MDGVVAGFPKYLLIMSATLFGGLSSLPLAFGRALDAGVVPLIAAFESELWLSEFWRGCWELAPALAALEPESPD